MIVFSFFKKQGIEDFLLNNVQVFGNIVQNPGKKGVKTGFKTK